MGGLDKGWVRHRGRPMIRHTLERLANQVDRVLISANRNRARYGVFGWPVVADTMTDYAGPLAGIAALLAQTRTPLLLLVPVDTPALPWDLVDRLLARMDDSLDIVVARSPGGVHPLHALIRRCTDKSLSRTLAAGERRVTGWQQSHPLAYVDWSDDAPFANINTPSQVAG